MKQFWFSLLLYGLTSAVWAGDRLPVTDFPGTDLQSFEAALDVSQTTGQTVYFPAGDYHLEGQPLGDVDHCRSIRLSGDGPRKSRLHNVGTIFATDTASMMDLGVHSSAHVMLVVGKMNSLQIERCRFVDCWRIVNTSLRIEDRLANVRIVDCEVLGTRPADDDIRLFSFRNGGTSRVVFRDNRFSNLWTNGGPVHCVSIMQCQGTAGDNRDVIVSGNVIEGIGNLSRAATSHGIICVANHVHISNNVVKNSLWTDGIYVRGSQCSVIGNSVADVEGGGITFKGPVHVMSENSICGNSVTGLAQYKPGLRAAGTAAVTGNTVDVSWHKPYTAEGGRPYVSIGNPLTGGNQTVTGNVFKGPRGVLLDGPDTSVFTGNVIESGEYGLRFRELAGAIRTNFLLTNNVITFRTFAFKCTAGHVNLLTENNIESGTPKD